MAAVAGHILVVDDYPTSRLKIVAAIKQLGHTSQVAGDGREALQMLRRSSFDLVLLDILMPVMDGYETLSAMQADPELQEIPVIVISSEQEDMSSVVRCISLGALDYLPKTFDPVLLDARVSAALEKKRVRDQELEYLKQVEDLTDAAVLVEMRQFQPERLDHVSRRSDALGRLARVFQRMAHEVYAREQRLEQQLERLRTDMAEMRVAQHHPLDVYVPVDRRHALAGGYDLPQSTEGAVLFADISGFTPLTLSLLRELGHRRGIEELPRHTNQVFDMLIAQVHRYGGSIISIGGDALTCWFDHRPLAMEPADPASKRALACALHMQRDMIAMADRRTFGGTEFAISIRVAVNSGSIERYLVGDPMNTVIEVIAGQTLADLAAAAECAKSGEVVIGSRTAEEIGPGLEVVEWRRADGSTSGVAALVDRLDEDVRPSPWPPLPVEALSAAQCRPWIPPAVFDRIIGEGQQFLAELRVTANLFLSFSGIDYEHDSQARPRLDRFVRWVESVAARFRGVLLSVETSDKGSYLFIAFGSPVAHADDPINAVAAALVFLQEKPEALEFIRDIRIGLAQGLVRTGTFGGMERRAYSVFGDQTNLAARLMQAAPDDEIRCDASVYQATKEAFDWQALPPIRVKGKDDEVPVFRPLGRRQEASAISSDEEPGTEEDMAGMLDALAPGGHLVLKIASVLGLEFSFDELQAVYPSDTETDLQECFGSLVEAGLVVAADHAEGLHRFSLESVFEVVGKRMLFAQRRHLHRTIAQMLEERVPETSAEYARLAEHWAEAGEDSLAIHYLELSGQRALIDGDAVAAERHIRQALALERDGRLGQDPA